MSTVFQSLKCLSSYPIPSATIENVAEESGLNASDNVTVEVRKSKSFMLTKAGIYDFLSEAPNISQSGISFSFSEDERKRFKTKADSLRRVAGYEDAANQAVYGYQGEDL